MQGQDLIGWPVMLGRHARVLRHQDCGDASYDGMNGLSKNMTQPTGESILFGGGEWLTIHGVSIDCQRRLGHHTCSWENEGLARVVVPMPTADHPSSPPAEMQRAVEHLLLKGNSAYPHDVLPALRAYVQSPIGPYDAAILQAADCANPLLFPHWVALLADETEMSEEGRLESLDRYVARAFTREPRKREAFDRALREVTALHKDHTLPFIQKLAQGVDLHAPREEFSGWSHFMALIHAENAPMIFQWLLDLPHSDEHLGDVDAHGQTVLDHAVAANFQVTARRLVAAGADPYRWAPANPNYSGDQAGTPVDRMSRRQSKAGETLVHARQEWLATQAQQRVDRAGAQESLAVNPRRSRPRS